MRLRGGGGGRLCVRMGDMGSNRIAVGISRSVAVYVGS